MATGPGAVWRWHVRERSQELRRYRGRIFDWIQDEIALVDATDYTIVDVNEALIAGANRKRAEVIGQKCHAILHCEQQPQDRDCPIDETLRTGAPATAEHVHVMPGGEERYVEISTHPAKDEEGKVFLILHISRDITERKHLEREAKETREYFENLVGTAGDAIVVVDAERNITTWNSGAELIYGYTKEEALGRPVSQLVSGPKGGQEVDRIIDELSRTGVVQRFEAERYRKDGKIVWVSVTNYPLRDNSGRMLGVSAIHKDVSDRKELEREILGTKEFLEGLIGEAGDAIASLGLDRVVRSWNNGAERMFGYTREEAVGNRFGELVVPRGYEEEGWDLFNIAARGEIVASFETLRRRKDGTLVEVSITNSPIRNNKGEVVGVSVIYKDVTERKELERQFLRRDRLASMGTLLAGVVRELVMPLRGLLESVEGMLDGPLPVEARIHLEELKDECSDCVEIVEQLLRFSGSYESSKRPLDLLVPLENALGLGSHQLTQHNVRVVKKVGKGQYRVVGDANSLEQVFANLIANAADAMPKGGTLEISARAVQRKGADEGKVAVVQFRDTGKGIPEDDVERVFDPFFTTKELGKGPGLGLSVAHGIITNHGGKLFIESKEEEGTTVTVELPLV
jgi:PAS domain S-box-containing protein